MTTKAFVSVIVLPVFRQSITYTLPKNTETTRNQSRESGEKCSNYILLKN